MAKDSAKPRSANYQTTWLAVLCLIGLDYLSTLGYQPSLAFTAAGRLAPLATVVVVLVTLLGALPVYTYLASRSPHGQGSFALLERLLPGWTGKTLLLILLGFAATDLVFTRTFSTADASEHLTHNTYPDWQQTLRYIDYLDPFAEKLRNWLPQSMSAYAPKQSNRQLTITLFLLILGTFFTWIFRRGYTGSMVRTAVGVVAVYLLLNVVVIGSGLVYLGLHPEIIGSWWTDVTTRQWALAAPPWHGQGTSGIIANCLLLFPKLALGLSGFELGLLVMPLIKGDQAEQAREPRGRVRNARKLQVTAVVIMGLLLLGSSFVTTTLIPPPAFTRSGQAAHRALAYLAHGNALNNDQGAEVLNPLFGPVFGTIYDISAILILCLAGASITLGLRSLVPVYLHRLGMELEWSHNFGAMLYIFSFIKVSVTIFFDANLNAQFNAYATSVMALITAAAFVSAGDRWKMRPEAPRWRRIPWLFLLIGMVFLATTLTLIHRQSSGLKIALCFIGTILLLSMLTRAYRSSVLR